MTGGAEKSGGAAGRDGIAHAKIGGAAEQDRGIPARRGENKNAARGGLSRVPAFVKAALLKLWFAGAVYFFIGLGVADRKLDQLDLTVAIGLIMGLATDLAVNRVLMAIDNKKKRMPKYLMFYRKKWYFLCLNLLYGLILSALTAYTYHFINAAVNGARGLPDGSTAFGAEPVLFGVFFLAYDLLLVGLRNGIARAARALKKERGRV
ncbi:MAG: hypothetical protein LBL66_11310 [Clostridiales bacterium]|nr:hypothetical protein [Clostridiales bacterium]